MDFRQFDESVSTHSTVYCGLLSNTEAKNGILNFKILFFLYLYI